jgi:ABC-2 type transport system ATP-binding protein
MTSPGTTTAPAETGPPPAVQVTDVGIKFLRNRKRKAKVRDFFTGRAGAVEHDDFWAVRNVTASIAQGETVGLIGANGSGKSTLLKLIAGVLLPDEGTVTVNGEIAPLLELGAGFAGDLSGRENIWLSGSIHGLSKEQTAQRFKAITRFAGKGVRGFLDTPVRHYSSGMKVRLGFAITAQLGHPILLIDEVLAVGDRRFKRRCYRRIEELLEEGRTLIIVSHSERDVRRFCERSLWMRDGRLALDASTEEVFAAYNEYQDADDDDGDDGED